LTALSPGEKALQLLMHALVRNFDGCNLTSESPDISLSRLNILQISEIVEVISPSPVHMCISELKTSEVTGVTHMYGIVIFTLNFMKILSEQDWTGKGILGGLGESEQKL
jgi:hypothetical protein